MLPSPLAVDDAGYDEKPVWQLTILTVLIAPWRRITLQRQTQDLSL